MIDKEYILCAAIRRLTPRDCQPYYNNDICNIEIGYRHHDILQRFKGEVSTKQSDQGFYTSKGRYVSRVEAMEIAYKAGQVTEDNYQIIVRDRDGNTKINTNNVRLFCFWKSLYYLCTTNI